jgi:shikimate kinase
VVKSTSANTPPNSKEKNSDRLKKRSGKAVGKLRARVQNKHLDTRGSVSCVFLVGFMGAGKSSVGRALGQQLNWMFEDLDDRIERREGRSVAEIFRDSGEAEFRRAEHAALRQVLDEFRGGAVKIVALGGGAFVQVTNAKLLRESTVPTVFLDAPVEELWRRCSEQAREAGAERPLLRTRQQFCELHEIRRKSYARASVRIETGGRSVDAIATEIAKKLGLKKIGIRTEQGEVE